MAVMIASDIQMTVIKMLFKTKIFSKWLAMVLYFTLQLLVPVFAFCLLLNAQKFL